MGRRIKRGETLLIATHNRGKLGEFADLLAPFAVKAVSAATLRLDEPEETGTTFEANARLKALAAMKEAGIATGTGSLSKISNPTTCETFHNTPSTTLSMKPILY